MKEKLKKITFLFILFSVSLSCVLNPSGINNVFNLASVGADYAPADSAIFYIDLDVDTYESNDELVPYYEISTSEEYGDSSVRDSPSNCEISYNNLQDKPQEKEWTDTLLCILDIPEFEFLTKDFHVVYNFPKGMCEYSVVSLPWHFNHPIQLGPNVAECSIGTGADVTTGFCDVANKDDTGCLPCVSEEEDVCVGSPKCCYGGAKIDGSPWEPDLECFGGPALATNGGGGFTRENFDFEHITNIPDEGLRNTISLTNLIDLNQAASKAALVVGKAIFSGDTSVSFPYANYLESLDVAPKDLNSIARNTLPDFLKQSDFYNRVPRLFFEFSCLDSAGEVLHKVLLMIREWNTFEEFYAFYSTGGSDSSDPDVEGTEGDECQYEERAILDGEFEQCNDLLDLDDIVNCNSNLYGAWCALFGSSNQVNNNYPRIPYRKPNAGGDL